MTTPTHRLIALTDDRGRPLLADEDNYEPEPGSVVLVHGRYGIAWQRHSRDGLWHCTLGRKPKPWDWIRKRRNVFLVYDAPEKGR